VVILGDSAAAHFHIPVPYMHAPDINETTYQNFIDILENEFDWPQLRYLYAVLLFRILNYLHCEFLDEGNVKY
jgi:hypothetical protein